MVAQDKLKSTYSLLLIAALAVFLGRGYQHLFWDAPYRTLLWDENWLKGIVEHLTSYSWEQFITSLKVDDQIQGSIRLTGIFYLFCGICVLFVRKHRLLRFPIYLGVVALVILAGLYMKEKFFHIGQFLEYSLQFMSPIFLIWYLRTGMTPRLVFLMKIMIALTFTCHGLYAVGYYPRPGNFVDMTINSLGLTEADAIRYLNFVGLMDFIIAVCIFLPWEISKFALGYAILWGTLTTSARLVSYVELDEFLTLLHQWGFEALYRLPHFIIPIAVFRYYYTKKTAVDAHSG